MKDKGCKAPDDLWGTDHPRDVTIQIVFSLVLGVGAFLAFCALRPRWKGLYAARKKHKNQANALPDLPDSFLGWILPLWRITEEQVLACAGLDAYAYLTFFKMAIKFMLVAFALAVVIIKPVHDHYMDDEKPGKGKTPAQFSTVESPGLSVGPLRIPDEYYQNDYLWMYLVFAYFFSGLMAYFVVSETRKVIEIRQDYLGTQTTITDRTIRLSGIPLELRSEEKIKEFMEGLEIGKVENVTLCRDWKALDDMMVVRMTVLRKLEEAWTVHLGRKRVERNLETLPVVQPTPPGPLVEIPNGHENTPLIADVTDENGHVTPYARVRPTTKIWHGRFNLRYKVVDAIDYYEEHLRRLDEQIQALRKKEFEPTPMAFVTLDKVASCQMAVQAVLDPSPLQLIANTSPSPTDVVWTNTYLSRSNRIFRAWSITVLIGLLSVLWTVLLIPIAGALNVCSINSVIPGFDTWSTNHKFIQSLVNTQLPTLTLSLLTVLVPYLYDWLSNLQGMISQGDVELSIISKNFFFTFFNFFVVFTILGTASGVLDMWKRLGGNLSNARDFADALASSLQRLLMFYTNFIILQGLGLFPLRLMEFGSIALYPVYRIGAKTPRDFAELVQPPVFSYGFYLPQTILIFVICMVYSVLPYSWMVLLAGIAYFIIGYFVHKYQLLYAMDHHQHSTGRGWMMICDRVIVGTIFFQVTMASQLLFKQAYYRSGLVVPLILATIWFSYRYSRTYRPLMKFIALKSLKIAEHSNLSRVLQEQDSLAATARLHRPNLQTVDEVRERGLRFVNPSLILPLEDIWIANTRPRTQGDFMESASNYESDAVSETNL